MDFQAMVEEFYQKHNIKPLTRPLRELRGVTHRRDLMVLYSIGEEMVRMAEIAEKMIEHENPIVSAIARTVHLLCEESGEMIQGMTDPNISASDRERLTLDGLADTQYIVSGTAYLLDLPLNEAFQIVHDSNMTKAVRKPGDPRVREKGPDYVAPNFSGLLLMDE